MVQKIGTWLMIGFDLTRMIYFSSESLNLVYLQIQLTSNFLCLPIMTEWLLRTKICIKTQSAALDMATKLRKTEAWFFMFE